MSDDPSAGPLGDAVAHLSEPATRRLLVEVLSRTSRRASGLRVVLCIDALLKCARDRGDFSSPAGYARWREQQPHPPELPSPAFITGAFENRWSAALGAGGLTITPGRRVQQRIPATGGYSREAVEDALRQWLLDTERADLTYDAYESWARQRVRDNLDASPPLSAPTFRAVFGSWQRAIAHVLGEPSARPRRGRDVRSNYDDAEIRAQIAEAAVATGLGARLTRAAYDEWSRAAVTARGLRPAHSETIRRRFGSWATALATAGLCR